MSPVVRIISFKNSEWSTILTRYSDNIDLVLRWFSNISPNIPFIALPIWGSYQWNDGSLRSCVEILLIILCPTAGLLRCYVFLKFHPISFLHPAWQKASLQTRSLARFSSYPYSIGESQLVVDCLHKVVFG